jgi:hypothetical protein
MITPATLASIDVSEFAARVAIHHGTSGGLCALVADDAALPALTSELADEIKYITNTPIRTIHVASTANATMEILAQHDNPWVILHGFSPGTPQLWVGIDRLRNSLQSIAGLVFVLSPTDLHDLQTYAPNLSSWIGGRVWRLADETSNLSPAEVEQRLATLRAAYGKTDDEVVTAARNNQLPPEPEYAEWLILLGHGGLIT